MRHLITRLLCVSVWLMSFNTLVFGGECGDPPKCKEGSICVNGTTYTCGYKDGKCGPWSVYSGCSNSISTANVLVDNAINDKNVLVYDAKAIVDSHVSLIKILAAQKADTVTVMPLLESMASIEAILWEKLSPAQKVEAREYAKKTLNAIPEIAAFLAAAAPPVKIPVLSTDKNLLLKDRVGGPCQIVGLIVCYRTCCSNGVGNGVAVCIGGATCQNCWSESCPP